MFNGLSTLWGREPAMILFAARMILYAFVAFGISLSETQILSLLGALEAILFVITRTSVVSPATYAKDVKEALYAGAPSQPGLTTEAVGEELSGTPPTA